VHENKITATCRSTKGKITIFIARMIWICISYGQWIPKNGGGFGESNAVLDEIGFRLSKIPFKLRLIKNMAFCPMTMKSRPVEGFPDPA
jgi:hypothetical protein